LASANLTLLDLLNAQSSAGSVDQLLATNLTMQQTKVLFVNALNNSGQTAAAGILNSTVVNQSGASNVSVGQLLNMTQGNRSALSSQFNVLDLLAGSAFLANGTNFLSIPSLGLTVPGLVSAGLTNFKLIQGMEGACYPDSVTTTQADIPLSIDINVNACALVGGFPVLGPLLGALTCTLAGGVVLKTAHVDLTLHVAQSAGTATSITCTAGTKQMTVAITSSLVTVQAKVTLLGSVLLDAPLAPTTAGTNGVVFQQPPDTVGTVRASGSGSIGLGNVTMGGLLGTVIDPVLQPVLQAIDPLLINPLIDSLGLRIAGADVRLDSNIDCSNRRLVG
jgi:hypothetical protein